MSDVEIPLSSDAEIALDFAHRVRHPVHEWRHRTWWGRAKQLIWLPADLLMSALAVLILITGAAFLIIILGAAALAAKGYRVTRDVWPSTYRDGLSESDTKSGGSDEP